MLKQKVRKFNIKVSAILMVAVLLIAAGPTKGFGVFAASCTSSADCQQQIANLNSQNAQAQQQVNSLQAQASSYEDAINVLSQQINDIQQQIVASQNQEDQLQTQIATAQVQLDQEKKTLGDNIKQMYLEGNVSTLEVLASSKNISDFVNKQTYRGSVQTQVKTALDKVNALKAQLQEQDNQVQQLLKTQQAQHDQLSADEDQQNQLLGYNESQQASFNQQIQSNKSALTQLYAQQAAIIAASFGGGGFHYGGTGGYPYANATCLNYSGNCGPSGGSPYGPYAWGYPPSNEYDGAGWGYRNCTSYAFWRLGQTTGVTLTWNYFPSVYNHGGEIKYSVLGNDFQNLGYAVNKDPNGTAVLAVNTGGTFGHIMYVEGVINGQAVVSQYNAGEDGLYSTGTLTNLSGIYFVHIQ